MEAEYACTFPIGAYNHMLYVHPPSPLPSSLTVKYFIFLRCMIYNAALSEETD